MYGLFCLFWDGCLEHSEPSVIIHPDKTTWFLCSGHVCWSPIRSCLTHMIFWLFWRRVAGGGNLWLGTPHEVWQRVYPWKWWDWKIILFFWGPADFQGRTVKLSGCNHWMFFGIIRERFVRKNRFQCWWMLELHDTSGKWHNDACRCGFVNQPQVMWLVSHQDLLKTKQPIFIISDDVTGEAAGWIGYPPCN